MENMNQTIVGRNAVMEVLRAGHQLDQIYVQRPPHTGSLNKILALAREGGVRVREVGKDKLDQLAGGENHQGVVALALAYAYTDVDVYKRQGLDCSIRFRVSWFISSYFHF